jgi:ribosomal protein S18 acetylase RimI-like enzyme
MAALTDFPAPRIVCLDRLRGEDIKPLLQEEITSWKETLEWDYSPSAELIERFVSLETLGGSALLLQERPIGYSYHVIDGRKGIIGGLFVTKPHRTVSLEGLLLEAALAELMKTRGIRRIEAQLMALTNPLSRDYPRQRWLTNFGRDFMNAPLDGIHGLPPRVVNYPVQIRPWTTRSLDQAAGLIARAYAGHVDGRINDLYRSAGGARQFLENIVHFPGCGSFFPPASFGATDTVTRRLSGIVLASLVASDVGHITQVCVDKPARATGLGYELMRRALVAMAEHGCRSVSLTVTSSNQEAIALYRRMGFVKRSEFAASVWEGF